VFEADGIVGGLAKTVECNGYRFDLGGHRFFTKLAPIQRLWETTLGEEFLVRPRLSRITTTPVLAYLQATDVVARLGIVSPRCAPPRTCGIARGAPCLRRSRTGATARQAFVRHVLQVVYREVWGISGSEIERRGRAANQGLLAREAILRWWGSAAEGDPDRGFTIATRPWTDGEAFANRVGRRAFRFS
jgi:phytoene dehydrogenase-like protein